MDFAAASSRTTHAHVEALDACRYLAGLIIGALEGRDKGELLAPRFSPDAQAWTRSPLVPPIDTVAGGSFHRRQPPEICGTGYVALSLEAALWAFATTKTFEEGALAAVNLGDDADTTGAVYGQLAGAYYGVEAIPSRWRKKLAHRETIESMARRLVER